MYQKLVIREGNAQVRVFGRVASRTKDNHRFGYKKDDGRGCRGEQKSNSMRQTVVE